MILDDDTRSSRHQAEHDLGQVQSPLRVSRGALRNKLRISSYMILSSPIGSICHNCFFASRYCLVFWAIVRTINRRQLCTSYRRRPYFLPRQARSNGSRHAWGAISWWMEFGPQEPGAYGRTGGGSLSSGSERSQRLSMPSAVVNSV